MKHCINNWTPSTGKGKQSGFIPYEKYASIGNIMVSST